MDDDAWSVSSYDFIPSPHNRHASLHGPPVWHHDYRVARALEAMQAQNPTQSQYYDHSGYNFQYPAPASYHEINAQHIQRQRVEFAEYLEQQGHHQYNEHRRRQQEAVTDMYEF